MSDRERVLHSIRAALGPARAAEPPSSHLDLSAPSPAELLGRVEAEAKAVGAEVHRGEVELAEPHAVTRAAWAIADTGTLVEYHGPGSDSTASALAEVHVARLDPGRILPDLATFYRRYREDLAASSGAHYAVFITGPSRTADIEQTLVLGAHGPKRLVIVIEDPGPLMPPGPSDSGRSAR